MSIVFNNRPDVGSGDSFAFTAANAIGGQQLVCVPPEPTTSHFVGSTNSNSNSPISLPSMVSRNW